jgi:hypothetical protein
MLYKENRCLRLILGGRNHDQSQHAPKKCLGFPALEDVFIQEVNDLHTAVALHKIETALD